MATCPALEKTHLGSDLDSSMCVTLSSWSNVFSLCFHLRRVGLFQSGCAWARAGSSLGGHVTAGDMPSNTWGQWEIVGTAPSLYSSRGNYSSDIAIPGVVG